MSISNTVTKVEEFGYDKTAVQSTASELEKTPSKETKTVVREELDASNKSLDATQLYLGEIGFSRYLLQKKKYSMLVARFEAMKLRANE